MAGARARPLNFSDQTYVAAADLLARAGEIQGRALASVGQSIATGLNTITSKKEAQKDRNLRKEMLDAQLGQRERENIRDEAYRRSALDLSRREKMASIKAQDAQRWSQMGMSLLGNLNKATSPQEVDQIMSGVQEYFQKAQGASTASYRLMEPLNQLSSQGQIPQQMGTPSQSPSGKT